MVSDQAPAREPRASPGPTKGAGGVRFLPPVVCPGLSPRIIPILSF